MSASDETLPRGIAKEGLRACRRRYVSLNAPFADAASSAPSRQHRTILDQGISIWRTLPHTQYSLYESVGRIVEESWIPLWPFFSPQSRKYLQSAAQGRQSLTF